MFHVCVNKLCNLWNILVAICTGLKSTHHVGQHSHETTRKTKKASFSQNFPLVHTAVLAGASAHGFGISEREVRSGLSASSSSKFPLFSVSIPLDWKRDADEVSCVIELKRKI